ERICLVGTVQRDGPDAVDIIHQHEFVTLGHRHIIGNGHTARRTTASSIQTLSPLTVMGFTSISSSSGREPNISQSREIWRTTAPIAAGLPPRTPCSSVGERRAFNISSI